MGFMDLCDRKGELPAAPIFESMNDAFAAFDKRLIAFDHARHLIALIGMHEKDDFVVSHRGCSFRRYHLRSILSWMA